MNELTTVAQMALVFTATVVPIVALVRYASREAYDPTPGWPQGVQEEEPLPWDIRRLTPYEVDAAPSTPVATATTRRSGAPAPTLP